MSNSTKQLEKGFNPLDLIRIVQPALSESETPEIKKARMDALFQEALSHECISVFSRVMHAVGIETGQACDINCRSWRCPRHALRWGMRTGSIIAWQLERTPCNLLLNLTTSEAGFTWKEIRLALQQFWRDFRNWYGPTKYVKIVESAKKDHGQVHLHCLVICPGLVEIMTNPPKDWPKNWSWPEPLFEHIKYMWEESLGYAAPHRKATKVVWCQPPREGRAAAFYAVGYITGTHKDETPDSTWQGRKFTYSTGGKNNFFDLPTAEIWKLVLIEKYGPQEKITFFWKPKADTSLSSLTRLREKTRKIELIDRDPLTGAKLYKKEQHTFTDLEKLNTIMRMPIVRERQRLAEYYSEHGHYPLENPFILQIYNHPSGLEMDIARLE